MALPIRHPAVVAALGAILSGGCAGEPSPAAAPPAPEVIAIAVGDSSSVEDLQDWATVLETAVAEPGDSAIDAPEPPGPVAAPEEWATDGGRARWVQETLEGLSLRQKVGQMLMPWVLGDFSPEGSENLERVVQLIDQTEVGGLIISSGTPLDVAAKLNLLQRRSRLPLLVSADLETGAGFRLRGAAYVPGGVDLGGATRLPSLMALGAVGDRFLAYEAGRITAEEARAVGIHVPFAPVLDVNNNAENPIINTRSFGEDPAIVAALGACLLRGIQDYGAIATGKHFPGHGNTSTDSHLSLPVIRLGLEDLERTELVPFREAIGAGIGAIMTAHIALPELTGDPRLPATLSPRVLTGLLREEMGFGGLVFTDAMDMEAIGRFFSREEAAALAVEAGADVLLMPPDPDAAIRGVMNAVLSGRIPVARIDESVTRILAVKAALDLHVERTVDLESVLQRVGIPEHVAVAQEIADRSLTLLRNRRSLLPLAGTPSAAVLSITYRRPSDLLAGRAFDARLRQTYARLQTVILGPDTSQDEYLRVLQRARSTDLVVVSLHITAVSYQGTVAAPPELVQLLREIAGSGRPHVVVSFGNPYLLGEFPAVQAYLLAWGGGEVSERAAARGLFGDVPVEGRAPTRIPPEFEIGDGIQLLARSGAPFPSRGTCG